MKNPFLRLISCLIALTTLPLLFTGCLLTFSDSIISDNIGSTYTAPPEVEKKQFVYYYNQLSEKEKTYYDICLYNLQERNTKITFNGTADGLHRALYALTLDYPELYWVQGSYSGTSSGNMIGNTKTEIEISLYNVEYSEADIKAFNGRVDEIVNSIKGLPTDYDKVLAAHDFIINNCVYFQEPLKAGDTEYNYVYSAYGCLVKGIAVCAGYSSAFKVILDKLGIESEIVVGYATANHSWNCVRLDGEYYNIDVTWDDPVGYDGSSGFISYDFFCIDDESFTKTHTIKFDVELTAPTCNGTKYDYYRVNSLFLEEYSFEAVRDILISQAGKDEASVKFGSQAAYDKAVEELLDKKHITDIYTHGCTYKKNENNYIIHFSE